MLEQKGWDKSASFPLMALFDGSSNVYAGV